jgi:hypothetical protein
MPWLIFIHAKPSLRWHTLVVNETAAVALAHWPAL